MDGSKSISGEQLRQAQEMIVSQCDAGVHCARRLARDIAELYELSVTEDGVFEVHRDTQLRHCQAQ
jgi:hypothetical protein